MTSGGQQGTLIQRVYLDGDTIYQNIVVGPGTIAPDRRPGGRVLRLLRVHQLTLTADVTRPRLATAMTSSSWASATSASGAGKKATRPAPAAASAATWASTSSIVPAPVSSVHHVVGHVDDAVLAALGDERLQVVEERRVAQPGRRRRRPSRR